MSVHSAPASDINAEIEEALLALKADGQYRFCREVSPLSDGRVKVDGQTAHLFCGNDYLGLSQDARLKEAACEAIAQYGTSSGSSRLVSGTTGPIVALETALAQFKQTEAALVFNSGYQANVSILQALLGPNDWVVADKLNHASLVDGCQLAQGQWTRYHHLNYTHLSEKLQKIQSKRLPDSRVWIVTDSVFSMDGDIADLNAIVALAHQYDACILVDEAHATGLYGDMRSSGQAEAQGVSQEITLQMGTFSKALGGFGAYVAGSRLLIDYLTNKARGLIYSTALPPATIAAAHKALEIVQTDPSPKQRLWQNVRRFEAALSGSPKIQPPLRSPIVPWLIGEAPLTMDTCQSLLGQGYFVQGIRPPTVPPGSARLRITLSAAHTASQIDGLCHALSGL